MTTAAKRRQQKIAEKAARKTARKKPGGGQLERRQQLVLQQSLDLAVQHHKAGDLRKAERIYNQILQADPNQPVALHLLGAIAHQVGKDDIAIELITKAVARKPDYAEAHYNLCYVLEKANRTEAFREAVGRARRDCPGHPRLSRGEALLLKWDGDFVAARALLEAPAPSKNGRRLLPLRSLTKVFDFLGVDWDDGVRNYIETAYRRGKINTPSYNQVTQPLYTRARGRWERYREQMQPVPPTLLPWAKRFEYGA